jgi:hypothetical protein
MRRSGRIEKKQAGPYGEELVKRVERPMLAALASRKISPAWPAPIPGQ